MSAGPDRWIRWTTTGCQGESTSAGPQVVSRVLPRVRVPEKGQAGRVAGPDPQRQAWLRALSRRAGDGSLPSGRDIARHYGHHERWARLIKRAGTEGQFSVESTGPWRAISCWVSLGISIGALDRLGRLDGKAILRQRGVPLFAGLSGMGWFHSVSKRETSVNMIDE